MDFKDKIKSILNNPSYKLAYLIILLILVFIVAYKEGLKSWVLSKLKFKTESEEGLVSGRGEPDFWEIGSELASSRRERMSTPLTLKQQKEIVKIL